MNRLTLATFARDDSGAVATEAVIVIPVLLFFYAAAFVFFDAFRTYSNTIKASYTISDIISRQTNTLDTNDIYGLKDLFRYLTFDSQAWIRVTQVERTSTRYLVEWSRATLSAPALTDTTLNPMEFKLPDMATGERIILVETFSAYTPGFNVGIDNQIFENFIVTRPRFAATVPFTNTACTGSDSRCDR